MKRQITGAAFGLLLALGTLVSGGTTAHAAAQEAPAEQGMVMHGCVITAGEDEVVFRVGGTAAGGGKVMHVKTTAIPNYDPATTADACGAIVVYQEDGVWYAQSISVTRDDSGNVEVNQNSGSRPAGPRGR